MATVKKRLEDVIKDLSSEDKARLVVEEPLRPEPAINHPSEESIRAHASGGTKTLPRFPKTGRYGDRLCPTSHDGRSGVVLAPSG